MINSTEDLNKFVTANQVKPELLLDKLAEHRQIVSPFMAKLLIARIPRVSDKAA